MLLIVLYNLLISGLQCLHSGQYLFRNENSHLLECRIQLLSPFEVIFTPSSVFIPVPEKIEKIVSFIMNNALDSKDFAINLNCSVI